MKKYSTLFKTLLIAVGLMGGVNSAWAQSVVVPTPVYFNSFETEAERATVTIVGNGVFEDDTDENFGKIFHNDPNNESAIRTNYLKLPTDVLSHSSSTKEMTIGFWVNKESENDYYWTSLFSAQNKAPYEGTLADNNAGLVNDWTMFNCLTREWLIYNLNEYDGGWSDFTNEQNDANANQASSTWLDDGNWHYYTVVLTVSGAKVYIDGTNVNSWSIDATGFFNKVSNLTYVCLGGNQYAAFADADPAFGFDDFAVYDAALSAEQIAQIMSDKTDGTVENTAITSIPYSVDFSTSGATIVPFDANVEIKSNSSGSMWALACSSRGTTATAYFDTDSDTDGNQPYSIAANEKVSATFTTFLGWIGYANTQTVAILNDGDVELASFTYNDQSTNITDVKIGGVTPDGFSAITGLKPSGDGFDKWTAQPNPVVVTVSISGSGSVTLNFVSASNNVNTSVVGTLPSATVLNLGKITYSNTTAGSTTFNNNRIMAIKSIALATETVSEANVTYKYVDTDNNDLSSLVADKTVAATIGASILDIIPDSYKTEFYNGDNSVKYVYDTFTCSDETVPAAGTTVTLKFAPKAKFTYEVKAVDAENTELATIASVEGYEGDSKSLYWSKYVKVGEQWYVADAPFYQGDISAGGTKNVTYTASDIAYFIECESMNGVRTDRWVLEESINNSGYRKIRINNYYSAIWTDAFAEGGVYKLELPYNNSNSSNSNYQIKTRDANGNYTTVAEWTCGNGNQTYVLEGIIIPAGSSLAISCDGVSGNSNARMDYVTLTKTADGTLNLNTSGYSTFSHSSAVEITGAIAYTAAVNEDAQVITLTPIEDGVIPANTGVVLKGDAGASVSYTATTTDKETISGNDLQAAATAISRPDGNIFVLSGDGFMALDVSVTTIPANKAYLVMSDGFSVSEGANLRVVFAGETTGIAGVEAAKAENGAIYNMAGQRVNGSYKGIVIKNGKKVFVR